MSDLSAVSMNTPSVSSPVSEETHDDPMEMSVSTKFKDMNELKAKAPKVFNAMMQGIAINIIGEMQDHQTRLKKLWRESHYN